MIRALRLRATACAFVVLATSIVACSSSDEESPAAASMGPQCTKYYGSGGCCVSVAGDTQAAKDACNQGKKAIDDALARGGSASSYEASCEQGVKAAQAIDKCK